MTSDTPLTIGVLSKEHARTAFDCGTAELNAYLARYALQNQKKHTARTYVALRENRVVGYYTLAFGSVSHDEAPPAVAMPHYPIPVILLARLAVDISEKGKGLGAGLLKDALLRTLQAGGFQKFCVSGVRKSATERAPRTGWRIDSWRSSNP